MESRRSIEYSIHRFAVLQITLSLLLCWFCPVSVCHGQTFACPSACQCVGLSVDCSGDNLTLSRVVQHLPANIESFRFSVHPSSLHEENIVYLNHVEGLGKFKKLLSFQIQPNSTSAPIIRDAGLRKNIFCNWVDLKEIHLNIRTHYHDSNANWKLFSCLQQLEVLDLSYSMGISDPALQNLLSTKLSRHITTLLLRNIQTFNSQETTEIHFGRLFSNLNRSSIEVIDLSANAIRDAHPGLLTLPNLKVLNLSENLFIYPFRLTPGAFLTLLEGVLHPSMTNFSFADPGLFVSGFWDPSGKSVSFGNPDLFSSSCEQKRTLSSPGFSQLAASGSRILKHSSCFEDKEVYSILHNFFENFQRNFSWCQTPGLQIPAGRHLEQVSASGLTKYAYAYRNLGPHGPICFNPSNILRTIDISNNHFGLIINNPSLSNVKVFGLNRIQSINLGNNDFQLDNFHFFDTMPSLEQLLLAGNKIQIHNDSQNELFKLLGNLSDLDLSRNDLETLPYTEFVHLSKLQRLDLSDNRLSDLNILLPNSSLRMLNLSGNGMTSLRASMADQFDRYPLEVDLQDNNFICNCKALWFVHWVQTTPVNLTRKDVLYCYTEEGLEPIDKINYGKLYKKCHRMSAFEVALIAASGVLCFILLIMGLIAVYRQRWRIRHYWYRRRLKQERFLLNDDYEYDAYVSYSDSSRYVRSWVSGALHEELECKRGLKLFIHQRDLLGGGFFLERVDAAMRNCRKTILVLSPEFLQSRTCLYEAWSAHTSMVTENRDAVVLLKLRPLPLAGLTGTLASLMQIRECLNWTADPIGQNLLWEQLEDVLLSVDNPIID